MIGAKTKGATYIYLATLVLAPIIQYFLSDLSTSFRYLPDYFPRKFPETSTL